jgi:hypothetical protein
MNTHCRKRLFLRIIEPKIGIPIVVVLAAISATLVYRESRLNGLPDIGEPFDANRFGTVDIPIEDNAFVDYNRASPTETPDGVDEVIKLGWPTATPAIRKWLDDNQVALQLMNVGSKKSSALIAQPRDQSYLTMIDVGKHRAMSWLVRLQAAKCSESGDVATALDWYLVALRHSRHIGMNAGVINRTVGASLHAVVCPDVLRWSTDPRVNSELLQRAFDQVQSAYELTQPRAVTLRCEYFGTLNEINDEELFTALNDFHSPDSSRWLSLFLENEPEVTQRLIKLTFANWLAQIDLPKSLQSRRRAGNLRLFDKRPGTSVPSVVDSADIESRYRQSPIADEWLGGEPRHDITVDREQCHQTQLVVALAAQLYFRENGRYPSERLEFAGIVEDWPLDQFAGSGALMNYRLDAGRERPSCGVWGRMGSTTAEM